MKVPQMPFGYSGDLVDYLYEVAQFLGIAACLFMLAIAFSAVW
jgi:hypothetical protein